MKFPSRFLAAVSALWTAFSFSSVLADSLEAVEGQAALTFKYSTSKPNAKNWIGVYYGAGGGPVDQVYVSAALVWEYIADSEGTITLPSSNLEPGLYTAFFLANDGYKWLADPVNTYISYEPSSNLRFLVDKMTLVNGRQGDSYSQKISGLIGGGGDSITFSKKSGPAWVKVNSNGVLSGTPTSASDATVTVLAGNGESSATAIFTIPVRPSGSPLVKKLSVLSTNLWHGGTQVNDYHEKQVRFLASSGADIVGIQEDQDGRHVRRLSGALGWHYWSSNGDVGILSKYPIGEQYNAISRISGGANIALDGDAQQINFYSAHLGYNPYGPYDICFEKLSKEKVYQNEEASGRTPQIKKTLQFMDVQLSKADQVPVILVGDFNAPSHLDYTSATADQHCGYLDVQWPTSVLPRQKGLIDSFRVANPDPSAVPGLTWSPVEKQNAEWNKPEPQDRIDFILHKGKGLKVLESRTVVVGRPSSDYKDNEWTSDHAAVLTIYQLN
ncbi:Endonuclease/exonuclease/phosphatase [Dactylonectria estremocensis]|uniref:Endonuclease/exonuclease/phosphatase n=1 Tax=Dactylonectria estremocensis TaxID=1079267 RepID=A0A9P9EHB6_9HYPO|nr:Endonuclease/exonuclease/phosphatase [Dactylonectria estremocensis]